MLIVQLCPTPCDPMDCSLPVSSVHGILQGRILEWVAIVFSRRFSQFRSNSGLLHCRPILLSSEPPGREHPKQACKLVGYAKWLGLQDSLNCRGKRAGLSLGDHHGSSLNRPWWLKRRHLPCGLLRLPESVNDCRLGSNLESANDCRLGSNLESANDCRLGSNLESANDCRLGSNLHDSALEWAHCLLVMQKLHS